jgi:hypothetical protein
LMKQTLLSFTCIPLAIVTLVITYKSLRHLDILGLDYRHHTRQDVQNFAIYYLEQ